MQDFGGELAQLVERYNGIVEVMGSIPLLSTTPPAAVDRALAGVRPRLARNSPRNSPLSAGTAHRRWCSGATHQRSGHSPRGPGSACWMCLLNRMLDLGWTTNVNGCSA